MKYTQITTLLVVGVGCMGCMGGSHPMHGDAADAADTSAADTSADTYMPDSEDGRDSPEIPERCYPMETTCADDSTVSFCTNNGVFSDNTRCPYEVPCTEGGCYLGGIMIQLVWYTPRDPDPTDECLSCGSDMDLLFMHGDNRSNWGRSNAMVVNWMCINPNWGDLNSDADDPFLYIIDPSGPGPEALILPMPENNKKYHVGVHYWDDRGLREAIPTIRILINGGVVAEYVGNPMSVHNFWFVATIHWGSGGVAIVDTVDEYYSTLPL